MSMKIFIGTVGRMKKGPESTLFQTYFERCNQVGSKIGLGPVQIGESVEARNPSKSERQRLEAESLSKMLPKKSRIIALDENGKNLSSVAFSKHLAAWRDEGIPHASFLIGGPDGLDKSLINEADLVLSLGTMTWPHMIARILLVEQIYRSISLLSGHPYHRA